MTNPTNAQIESIAAMNAEIEMERARLGPRGLEAIKSGLPEEPWTYRKSIPTDGFECFIVEAADGLVVIEVPGPQNEHQESLARRIASIPAMSAENDRLCALNAELVEALTRFYPHAGCPVCSGDCGSANPSVVECPMHKARAILTKIKAAGETAAEGTETA